jgi:hypothetical protein
LGEGGRSQMSPMVQRPGQKISSKTATGDMVTAAAPPHWAPVAAARQGTPGGGPELEELGLFARRSVTSES